jgi:hypothetical protein
MSTDGTFGFTVTSDDTNPPARDYSKPIVCRYVERHADPESALAASAFLSGTTKGMLDFLEPGDAIYLASLAVPIPEEIRNLWVIGHQDSLDDPQIDR